MITQTQINTLKQLIQIRFKNTEIFSYIKAESPRTFKHLFYTAVVALKYKTHFDTLLEQFKGNEYLRDFDDDYTFGDDDYETYVEYTE